MVNVLWIGDNPKTSTSSTLMGWPICKRLALKGYDVFYLALNVFSTPYEKDNVKVIPTIIQDEKTPQGLGSVQNMYNMVYKRVTPDVVIICLDKVKTKEILYQLEQIEYNNIIVWGLSNEDLQVENEHIKIVQSKNCKGKQQKPGEEYILFNEDLNTVTEKWCELLKPYQNHHATQLKKSVGINFKGNIWGNGSMPLTSRLLAHTLESMGVDVSLENTVVRRPEECFLLKDEQEKNEFVRMERKKINADQYVHIRYSGPQESETHLLEGHFDYTIGKRNIAYWSIDYSSLDGPGCPSADLLNQVPDQIWVPSTHSKMAMLNAGVIKEKVKIVPNGYLDNVFFPMQTIQPEKKKFVFLHVSNFRFYLRKGVDVLLESFIKAFDQDDDVELRIHSQYNLNMEEILGMISKFQDIYKHKPEIVIKINPLSHKELAVKYNECDCFVFPSRGESFGLPPLEAMACKKPVIVTNWGGMLDFCNRENAYFIDYDLEPINPAFFQGWGGGQWANPRVDSLVETMLHVYNNPIERNKKAECASETAKEWTWKKAACKANEIIQAM